MKAGRDLPAIAAEIKNTRTIKDDLVIPGGALRLDSNGETLAVMGSSEIAQNLADGFHLTDTAHGCLSKRLDIPKTYYNRMRTEAPELLSWNVNNWLATSKRHLVRTLNPPRNFQDGNPTCRAILSDRYKIIDNDLVMEKLFPILQEQTGMEIASSEITESKFYLKARFPAMEREIKLNDPVQAGVVITNSEVGAGSISVALLIYRLRCLNGMVIADEAFKVRRAHLGGVLETTGDFRIAASDETQRLADEAFVSSLKDIVRLGGDPDVFADICDKLMEAAEQKIEGNVESAIERVTERFSLSETEGASVLENLIRDGDYTKWGVANAVTRTAEDVPSYDRATELERLGGNIIELSERNWMALAA